MLCHVMNRITVVEPIVTSVTFFLLFNLWQEKDFRIRISLPPDHQMKQAKYDCNNMVYLMSTLFIYLFKNPRIPT